MTHDELVQRVAVLESIQRGLWVRDDFDLRPIASLLRERLVTATASRKGIAVRLTKAGILALETGKRWTQPGAAS